MIRIDHVVLEVTDPERSVAFYEEIVGLAPVRLDEFRAGAVKFPSLRIDDSSLIDLFPRAMWHGSAPSNPNHLCLATTTEALAALRGRLAARSIPITRSDDHNFGARGFGRSIYFDDPDGISIEVRDYPPG
ncbi:MAG TPA: VOC family protein [Kofleriaceae bacterium]|jgi:catechol 2,3-dioxygenase-like lactoylglutathione lyase family enzyme|nr:VOC family protein [Kofleriaceae bacterium]